MFIISEIASGMALPCEAWRIYW